jgi:hypothetical protein
MCFIAERYAEARRVPEIDWKVDSLSSLFLVTGWAGRFLRSAGSVNDGRHERNKEDQRNNR